MLTRSIIAQYNHTQYMNLKKDTQHKRQLAKRHLGADCCKTEKRLRCVALQNAVLTVVLLNAIMVNVAVPDRAHKPLIFLPIQKERLIPE